MKQREYRRTCNSQLGNINVSDVGSGKEVWLSGILGSNGFAEKIERKKSKRNKSKQNVFGFLFFLFFALPGLPPGMVLS